MMFESVLWQDEQSLCSLSSSPLSIKTLKLSSSRSTCKKRKKDDISSTCLISTPSSSSHTGLLLIGLKYMALFSEQVVDFTITFFLKNLANILAVKLA